MEQSLHQETTKKKRTNKALRIIPWVGTGLFIVVMGIGIYFLASKKPIVVAPAGGNTAVSTIVCGDTIVGRYNAASKLEVRGSGTDPVMDLEGLNQLEKDIRATDGYDKDPTCQTILFWNAIINTDKTKASVALTAIKKLHDAHQFADSNLMYTTSLSSMTDTYNATQVVPKQ